MFAILKTGGKQYKVAPGDRFQVEKLDAEVGASVLLDDVLMVVDGAHVTTGTPRIVGASVKVTVLEQTRTGKLIVFKKKRRQNYRRKKHHRQLFTVLRVEGITVGG